MFSLDQARTLLDAAGIFFDVDDDNDEPQVLNMNDVWCWASADCEHVPDDNIQEVADLFFRYGFAGILYWVSCRNEGMRSEFHDNNRMIDFVANEEKLRKDVPDSTKRAYTRISYTLGMTPNGQDHGRR